MPPPSLDDLQGRYSELHQEREVFVQHRDKKFGLEVGDVFFAQLEDEFRFLGEVRGIAYDQKNAPPPADYTPSPYDIGKFHARHYIIKAVRVYKASQVLQLSISEDSPVSKTVFERATSGCPKELVLGDVNLDLQYVLKEHITTRAPHIRVAFDDDPLVVWCNELEYYQRMYLTREVQDGPVRIHGNNVRPSMEACSSDCSRLYNPSKDKQRYCRACRAWYNVCCTREPAENSDRDNLPVIRGFGWLQPNDKPEDGGYWLRWGNLAWTGYEDNPSVREWALLFEQDEALSHLDVFLRTEAVREVRACPKKGCGGLL